MGSQRRLRADAGPGEAFLQHPAAAAQRDRHAAHGPCVQPDDHGRADALPPHEGLQHPVGAGHRPCRHRHADRRRAPVAGPRRQPPRPGPRGLRGKGLAVEGTQRQHHHAADAPHGRQRQLGARVLHHGSQAVHGGHRDLRAAVRGRADLPRQAAGELGPGAEVGRLRPGGRERGGRRLAVADPLSAGGRRRQPGGGHHAAGDHARRRGGDGAPRGRALCRAGGKEGAPAAVRPRHPGHRRRLRRSRLRHRRGQGDAGARCQRLCGGPAPRAADDRRAGARCHRQRPGAGGLPRAGPLRRAQEGGRRPGGAGPAGRGEEAQADGAALRAHRADRRADAHRPVVRGHHQAGRRWQEHRAAGDRGGGLGRGEVRARAVGQHLPPVDEQHPGLVHQPPAVVGPPDPGLVRQRRRAVRRAQRGRSPRAGHGGRLHGRADPRRGRARHLVQLGAGALLHAGLAGQDPRAGPVPAQQRAGHRLRHHLLLGRPDDHDDHALHRQGALPPRLHPRPGARCAGPQDEQVRRQRARPGGPDRRHRPARAAGQAQHRACASPRPRRACARTPRRSSPTASPATAPMRCASPSRRWPAWGATSASTASAARATAISATSCGTPRASC